MRNFLLIVLLVISAGLFISWGFFQKVGNVGPAVLPPKVESKRAGEAINFSLNLTSGFKIGLFAKNLAKARDLQLSPGGTMLLSINDRGRVVALPDNDQNGQADETKEVLSGLDKPHGLAFFN